jgi:hypothetical protein
MIAQALKMTLTFPQSFEGRSSGLFYAPLSVDFRMVVGALKA